MMTKVMICPSKQSQTKKPLLERLFSCDPAGIRTQDPYIKSVLLYQLSYQIRRSATYMMKGVSLIVVQKYALIWFNASLCS